MGPAKVVFHIGVHKTATSHLQRCLRRAHDRLLLNGVSYRGPADLRAPARGLAGRFGLQDGNMSVAAQSAAMAELGQGAPHLLLSEENFIGALLPPAAVPVAQRYPDAAARLTRLAIAMDRQIDVAIAVRHPLDFLNAAYSQSLIAEQRLPPSQFQRRHPVSSVDWLGLLDSLGAAQGVGRITVWRYEVYAVVFPQIIAALVGVDAAQAVRWRDRRVNASLSKCAVDAVLAGDLSALNAREKWPVGPSEPRFDGYHADQTAMVDASYHKTWADICANDRFDVLRMS